MAPDRTSSQTPLIDTAFTRFIVGRKTNVFCYLKVLIVFFSDLHHGVDGMHVQNPLG